jgi:TfoX/Sxy family transcriptional regulator of competence genes
MAYDETVAQRVKSLLSAQGKVVEKRMFGGLAFMLRGNMCCGVLGKELMVRVGPEEYEAALSVSHTREMDFTGRPLKGFVYVEPKGFAADKDLEGWIKRAVQFARSLPPK